MPNSTTEGLRVVSDTATRHGFSAEAALDLVDSLIYGQGTQAQVKHPELGDMGQWSRGGMIMVGDMFNHELKYRAHAVCDDLSGLLGQLPRFIRPSKALSPRPRAAETACSWAERLIGGRRNLANSRRAMRGTICATPSFPPPGVLRSSKRTKLSSTIPAITGFRASRNSRAAVNR